MLFTSQITTVFTGALLLGAAVPCVGQNNMEGNRDRQIQLLEQKLAKANQTYKVLAQDLAASKQREEELTKSLNDLKLKFAALGDNLLDGEGRKLEAVKDAEVLDKQNRATEKAALKLMANLREYLRTAIIADSDARLHLETSIRELDVALRIRQNPPPQIALGSLHQAKVVSIDAESGMLVINAGENQSVRRGMTFSIMRGSRKVAEGIVAETREYFSGILPTEFDDKMEQIRLGDVASIQTTQR
ncbi:MAG: hypothetical protein ACSHX0_09055 [Akkermansiaceae bacterium]